MGFTARVMSALGIGLKSTERGSGGHFHNSSEAAIVSDWARRRLAGRVTQLPALSHNVAAALVRADRRLLGQLTSEAMASVWLNDLWLDSLTRQPAEQHTNRPQRRRPEQHTKQHTNRSAAVPSDRARQDAIEAEIVSRFQL